MWHGTPPPGYNNQFRIFDNKLPFCEKFKIIMVQLLLFPLIFVPLLGQIRPWYTYKTRLRNMKFGGSDPYFAKEFTLCEYISKYCTVGACGCCGMALKRWVDTNIRMGEPKFDKDMAEEDAAADAANPEEMERTPSFLPRMQSSSIEGAAVAPMHELKVVTIADVTIGTGGGASSGQGAPPPPKEGGAMGGSSTNVYVTTVVDDGAAAGFVKSGDKLVAINGTIMTDAVQATAVAKAAVGDVVYSIFRGSEFVMVTVKKATATTKLGVTVANMPAAPDDVAPTRELKVVTIADVTIAVGPPSEPPADVTLPSSPPPAAAPGPADPKIVKANQTSKLPSSMPPGMPPAEPINKEEPETEIPSVPPPASPPPAVEYEDLASLLRACGLEGRLDVFEQEAYTMSDLKTALGTGQDVALADLRELKLPLGECRKIISELQAPQ